MSTPAAWPCRVITISCSCARRRYRERSSFTLASATFFTLCSFALEPGFGFGLADDRKDFNRRGRDVIEHPHLSDAEPILGPAQSPKALDPTLAHQGRLVSQVTLDRVPDLRTEVGWQGAQLADRARREHDRIAHSGYNIAIFGQRGVTVGPAVKRVRKPRSRTAATASGTRGWPESVTSCARRDSNPRPSAPEGESAVGRQRWPTCFQGVSAGWRRWSTRAAQLKSQLVFRSVSGFEPPAS